MNERIKPFYECSHCGKKLTTEARLAKHNCDQKKRHDYLQTMKGKSAFYCYKTWLNLQGRQVRDIDVFKNSKYFNSIVEFVKFCNRVGIPDRRHFIEYMVEKAIMPTLWISTDVYEDYIAHFDLTKTPEQMASITMDTIFDLGQIFDCEPKEVFTHMNSSDIMRLVVARKLSPWILLFSPGFHSHLRHDTTPEQRIMISSVIDHKVWGNKFREDPESVKTMKRIIQEFDL